VGGISSKGKDLSFSQRPKIKLEKEVVRSDGTIQRVPYGKWKLVVLNDPLGATAQRARKNKDPDLKTIKIARIPINVFHEAPIVEGRKTRPPIEQTRQIDHSLTNLSPEEYDRMGFRRAELDSKGRKDKGKIDEKKKIKSKTDEKA